MSSRRLAIRQPESFALSEAAKKKITAWTKKYPKGRQRSALIPALWIAQKDAGGWLPEAALREIGDMLDMAYIRVYEVVTFYTMFNMSPIGKFHIQLCGTTPCWLRGYDGLAEVLERRIGPKGSVSEDGNLSWAEVECLGACANAPMAQISDDKQRDDYYEDLTPESLETLLDNMVAGKPYEAGPQNSRHTSEPEGGNIALKGEGPFHTEAWDVLPNAGKKGKLTHYNSKGRAKVKAPAAAKKKAVTKTAPAETKAGRAAKPKVIYTDGPTDGAPDDLKKIKGIGPKFEGDLNGKGIYYFRQIAAWKAADVKTVEELIGGNFAGRIKRDEWVKQAKALAKDSAKKA